MDFNYLPLRLFRLSANEMYCGYTPFYYFK